MRDPRTPIPFHSMFLHYPLLATLVGSTLASAPAHGREPDPEAADARLARQAVELKQHEVSDTKHVATVEIGRAEALRDKARSQIGQRRERESLIWTLDELDGTLALIAATLHYAKAEATRVAAAAKKAALVEQVAKARAHADALERDQAAVDAGGGAK